MQQGSYEHCVKKKYIFPSALASLLLPAMLMGLVFKYGFGSPESDSGAVQGFAFTFMLFPAIFLFQLVAYWVLGKSQAQRIKPSLVLGVVVGAVLAVPLSVVVLTIALTTGAQIWEAIFGSALFMFLPLWASFTLGSSVQYYLMVRNA